MVLPGDCNRSTEIKYSGMHGTIRKQFNSGDEEGLNKYWLTNGSQKSSWRRQMMHYENTSITTRKQKGDGGMLKKEKEKEKKKHQTPPVLVFVTSLLPPTESSCGSSMHRSHRWNDAQWRSPVPGFPRAAGMHYWNKENTLTFPVAPHTVHLGGISSGLHHAVFRGPRLWSSGARSRRWGCSAGLAVPVAADRLRLHQPAHSEGRARRARQRISAARPGGCQCSRGCGRRSTRQLRLGRSPGLLPWRRLNRF